MLSSKIIPTCFSGIVGALEFTPDGTQLAVGDSDGIKMVSTESWETVKNRPFPDHHPIKINNLRSIKFSPCGKYMTDGPNENIFEIYGNLCNPLDNTTTVETRHCHKHVRHSFSPCGNYLIFIYTVPMVLYKTRYGGWHRHSVLINVGNDIIDVIWGEHAIVCLNKSGIVNILSPSDFSILKTLTVCLNVNGQYVIALSKNYLVVHRYTSFESFNGFYVFNTKNWLCCHYYNTQNNICNMRFSPDGRYLVASTENGIIDVWSTTNSLKWGFQFLKTIKSTTYQMGKTVPIAISDKYIACGESSHVRLWNLLNWSDRINSEFNNNVQSIVFYIMCLFDQCYFADVCIEMLLEMLEYSFMIMGISCKENLHL